MILLLPSPGLTESTCVTHRRPRPPSTCRSEPSQWMTKTDGNAFQNRLLIGGKTLGAKHLGSGPAPNGRFRSGLNSAGQIWARKQNALTGRAFVQRKSLILLVALGYEGTHWHCCQPFSIVAPWLKSVIGLHFLAGLHFQMPPIEPNYQPCQESFSLKINSLQAPCGSSQLLDFMGQASRAIKTSA